MTPAMMSVKEAKGRIEVMAENARGNHDLEKMQALSLALRSLDLVEEMGEALKWFIGQEEDIMPPMPPYEEGMKKAKTVLAKYAEMKGKE